MVKVFISLGLQSIKGTLKGELQIFDLQQGQQIEFVEEKELAEVVLTEPTTIHLFSSYPTVVLSDNFSLLSEFENVVDVVSFPTNHNDLAPVIKALTVTRAL